MHWLGKTAFISVIFIFSVTFGNVSLADPSRGVLQKNFYSYEKMATEIESLASAYPQLLRVSAPISTAEGRSMFFLELGSLTGSAENPAIMAVFAQHASEHATTSLAMEFVKLLLSSYGSQADITKLLDEKRIYIVPMANPDGVEYNLYGGGSNACNWRKNRRPADGGFGVDLNRNWGHHWSAPIPDSLARSMSNPYDSYYHGDKPFSELETQVLCDYITRHKNIKRFIDYHSGTSDQMQGEVLLPFCYTDDPSINQPVFDNDRRIHEQFAALISNPADKRVPFTSMQAYAVKDFVLKNTPFWQKPFVKAALPPSTLAPGSAIDWVAAENIPALGVEILCRENFAAQIPASLETLVQRQFTGFLFLLGTL